MPAILRTPAPLASVLPAVAGAEGSILPLQADFPDVPEALQPGAALAGNPVSVLPRF